MGVGLVGISAAVEQLRGVIAKAAATDADVLIVGETGTGKELVAHAIHECSRRSLGPYITINCGALDENLLMDALFGHVKGAFSEAKGERQGAFLAANGGTLLLDELGNASMRVQQALLRALSARKIQPLGSDREIPFDTRVIAATNANLEDMVRQGLFREDLYFRLQVLTIATPSLRQRKEDIPLLAAHFLQAACEASGRSPVLLSRGAVAKLMAYDWPGNIRELKNCILRVAAFVETGVIQAEDLLLGNGLGTGEGAASAPPLVAKSPEKSVPPAEGTVRPREALTPRQQRGLEYLRTHGSMTRKQYESLFEERIASRTALYDLKELVRKGYAVLEGKGPSTRYVLAEDRESQHRGG
jgi:DNA-binding NtrC family response regulator